jgi:hypothetical protein
MVAGFHVVVVHAGFVVILEVLVVVEGVVWFVLQKFLEAVRVFFFVLIEEFVQFFVLDF